MTGYSLKGIIAFWAIAITLVIAFFSGEFEVAGTLLLYLIAGMILYQVGRFFIRGLTGFDPDDGTTRSDRELAKKLKEELFADEEELDEEELGEGEEELFADEELDEEEEEFF